MKKNLFLSPILLFTIAVFLSGCRPDLVVTTLEPTGSPTVNAEGLVEIPIRVVVSNQGNASAGIFKVSTEYTVPRGTYAVSFNVPGQSSNWYPYTDAPLEAGSDVTFTGIVTFQQAIRGMVVSLKATADSCSGDEFMADHCRVRESNEENNESAPIEVSLP